MCGAASVRLVYGLPSDEQFEAAERGEIELAGCLIGPDAPRWRCPAGHEWR